MLLSAVGLEGREVTTTVTTTFAGAAGAGAAGAAAAGVFVSVFVFVPATPGGGGSGPVAAVITLGAACSTRVRRFRHKPHAQALQRV